MNATSIETAVAIETTDIAANDLRLLTEFEVVQVGGGENVAGFF